MTAHPNVARRTFKYKLTSTSKTDFFTVGEGNDTDSNDIELTSIRVVDSTGAVNASVRLWMTIAGTEYVETYDTPIEANYPRRWFFDGDRLYRGDKITIQGGSGHHVTISYIPIIASGGEAQR